MIPEYDITNEEVAAGIRQEGHTARVVRCNAGMLVVDGEHVSMMLPLFLVNDGKGYLPLSRADALKHAVGATVWAAYFTRDDRRRFALGQEKQH